MIDQEDISDTDLARLLYQIAYQRSGKSVKILPGKSCIRFITTRALKLWLLREYHDREMPVPVPLGAVRDTHVDITIIVLVL